MRYLIEKNGERQNVNSLAGYEDWTVLETDVPPIPDDHLRAESWENVKAHRDRVRYGGCMTPKGRMDNDPESQRLLSGAVAMSLLLGDAFSVDWVMEDNTVVTHNAQEIQAAGVALGLFDAQCHAVGQALREQLETGAPWVSPENAPWPT